MTSVFALSAAYAVMGCRQHLVLGMDSAASHWHTGNQESLSALPHLIFGKILFP